MFIHMDASVGQDNKENEDFIFFPLPSELTFSKIKTHSATQRQVKTEGGRGFVGEGIEVQINGRELAVFCVNNKLYCIDEKCPHAGGPLHLGDIEDIFQSSGPCVTCPWHKFCFNMNDGQIVYPSTRTEVLNVYPVRIDNDTGQVLIGFKSFHRSFFNSSNF